MLWRSQVRAPVQCVLDMCTDAPTQQRRYAQIETEPSQGFSLEIGELSRAESTGRTKSSHPFPVIIVPTTTQRELSSRMLAPRMIGAIEHRRVRSRDHRHPSNGSKPLQRDCKGAPFNRDRFARGAAARAP